MPLFPLFSLFLLLSSLNQFTNALTLPLPPLGDVPCECHTWHNITVMKGTWDVEIVPIFQGADFYMGNCTRWVDSNNASIARFTVSADGTNGDGGMTQFGYLPTNDDTFDCAYSLTLVYVPEIELLRRTKNQQIDGMMTDKMNSFYNFRAQEQIKGHGSSRSLNFQHMACVFTITAAAPANPDVRAQEYNGALCRWDINPGVGENYYIDYVYI